MSAPTNATTMVSNSQTGVAHPAGNEPDVEKAVEEGQSATPIDNSTTDDGGDEGTDIAETAPPLPFSKARCIALVATVTGASYLNTVNVQMVVIILPTIGNDLGIPESRLQWVISAYSLTFGCFLLLWGRIGDLYGKKLIFLLGSGFLAITMIINPFMNNEIAFDLFRGLQGLGAAANVPTAIGILGTTFPPGKAKNYAFSAYASGAPLGAISGNLISGFIASFANWRWVFGVTGGLSILITVAGFFVIPAPPAQLKAAKTTEKRLALIHSVDWLGGFLITVGLLALLFALTEGNVVGWDTVWIYLLIVISLLLIAAFGAWQWYQETHTSRAPLMRVSVFKSGRFVAANVIMALAFGSFNDLLIYATYLFQDYQDLSAIETTLRFIPTGVFGLITAIIVSQMISRMPTWMLLVIGNICVAIGNVLLAVPINPHTTYWALGFPSLVIGVVGVDTAWPCLTLFTSATLPQADQALAGALINASGQIGRSIALAISTAIQTTIQAKAAGVPVTDAGQMKPWDEPTLEGLRAAHWFNLGLALLCMMVVTLTFRGTGIVGKIQKVEKKTEEQRQPQRGVLENGQEVGGETSLSASASGGEGEKGEYPGSPAAKETNGTPKA